MVMFKPGNTIAVYEPIVSTAHDKMKRLVCDYCLNLNLVPYSDAMFHLKTCSKCREMFYCDRVCHRKDWKAFHKYEKCDHPDLKITSQTRLGFRCYIAARPGLIKSFTMPDGSVRKPTDEPVDSYRKMLMQYLKLHEELQKSGCMKLKDLLGNVLGANSFNINPQFGRTYGVAIYLELSGFDHSCLPNAVTVAYGKNFHIRAIKNIDTEIELITINYFDAGDRPKLEIDEYPSLLKKFYNVVCKCQLCVDVSTRNQGEELSKLFRLMTANHEKDVQENTVSRIIENSRISMEAVTLSRKVFGNYHPVTLEALAIAFRAHGGYEYPQPKGLPDEILECARLICGDRHDYVIGTEIVFRSNPRPGTPYGLSNVFGLNIPWVMTYLSAKCKNLTVGEKV